MILIPNKLKNSYVIHIERSIAKANPLNYFPIFMNSPYTNETRNAISKCIKHANSRSFAFVSTQSISICCYFGHLWQAKCPTNKGLKNAYSKGITRGLWLRHISEPTLHRTHEKTTRDGGWATGHRNGPKALKNENVYR